MRELSGSKHRDVGHLREVPSELVVLKELEHVPREEHVEPFIMRSEGLEIFFDAVRPWGGRRKQLEPSRGWHGL